MRSQDTLSLISLQSILQNEVQSSKAGGSNPKRECPFLNPCVSQGSICNLKSFQVSIHCLKYWFDQPQRSTQMYTEGFCGFTPAMALTWLCAVCRNNPRSQQSRPIGRQFTLSEPISPKCICSQAILSLICKFKWQCRGTDSSPLGSMVTSSPKVWTALAIVQCGLALHPLFRTQKLLEDDALAVSLPLWRFHSSSSAQP